MNSNKIKTFTIFLGIITSLVILSKSDYVLKLDAPPKEIIHQNIRAVEAPTKNNEKSSYLLESNFISAYIKMRSSATSEQKQKKEEGSFTPFNFLYKITGIKK